MPPLEQREAEMAQPPPTTMRDSLPHVDPRERDTLRHLARRVAEISALPVQAEKARLWRCLNAMRPERPMVLADPHNGWRELIPQSSLVCEGLWAYELSLRRKIYRHEHIHDDYPITATLDVPWAINVGDYGLKETQTRTADWGSYRWDPPIKTEADGERLHPRAITVDREATDREEAMVQDLVGVS